MAKDPSDDNKFEYYNAKQDYERISKLTGLKSPAKEAARRRKAQAAAEKAQGEVADELAKAKTAADVAAAITRATKGASKVAAKLAQSETPDALVKVLAICEKDRKLAMLLAKRLTAAKTEKDVAKAMAEVKLEQQRRGGADAAAMLAA